jgi:hypothetical protein
MKALKAVFGRTRDFVLSDHNHNLWIKYFSQPTPIELLSVPKKSTLAGHYSGFNLQDVNPQALLAESKSIKANPEQSLTIILSLEQPITPHYFQFCRCLLDLRLPSAKFEEIASEASAHLVRALIAFTVQFRRDLLKFLDGKDSPYFPLKFFDEVPALVDVLLRVTSITQDLMFLLHTLLVTYLRTLSGDNPLRSSLFGVFGVLLNFIKVTKSQVKEIASVFSFSIQIFENFAQWDEEFALFCSHVTQNTEMVIPFFSRDSFAHLFANMDKVMHRMLCKEPNEHLFGIGLELLKCLNATFSSLSGEFFFAKTIFDFLEWAVALEPKRSIEKSNINEIPVVINSKWPKFFTEFIDEDLFDPTILKQRKLPGHTPKNLFDDSFHALRRLAAILVQLCQKSEKVMELLIKAYLVRKCVINRYVMVRVLSQCNNKKVCLILGQIDCWDSFIDAEVLNSATLIDIGDPLLLNLKDISLSVCEHSEASGGVPMFSSFYKLLEDRKSVV